MPPMPPIPRDQQPMPPMPPMPPPGPPRRHRALLLGLLGHHRLGGDAAGPRRDAASCSAVRTTLAGSMMPAATRSPYSSAWASKPQLLSLALAAACRPRPRRPGRRSRRSAAPAHWSALRTISTPTRWSSLAGLTVVERLDRVQQRHAAAGDDALLDRGAGRVQRVVDAVLALLHLGLGRAADADHRHAAGQLRQPLLQLLAVVVARWSPRSAP